MRSTASGTASVLAMVLATGLGATTASGDITWTTQTRSVRVTASIGGAMQSASAPDFAPWNESVEIRDTMYFYGGFASLTSSLDAGGLHASANAKGYDGLQQTHGDGRVELDATFLVSQPTPYHLSGDWSIGWDAVTFPEAHVRFGPAGAPSSLLDTSSNASFVNPFLSASFNQRGLLQPGQYRVQGLVHQTANTAIGTGQLSGLFEINLDVFCSADYDGSGSASVQDIFEFLAGYFSNDPRADYDGSGGITVQDIFEFLAVYFTGCE